MSPIGKKIIKGCSYSIILFTFMLLLLVSCKKDNKNDSGPALGSTGPLVALPTSGDAGTLVTINGSGFSTNVSDDVVTFNGVRANVVSAASTQLVVQSPQNGTTGAIEITVGGKKASAGTYTYQTLSIHSVRPVNGPTGTNIQISGAGFGSTKSPATVTVNGASAIVTSVTDTLLVAAVPANAGTGPVVVTVDGLTAIGPIFTYQSISSILPVSGGAGTIVTIKGTGFSNIASGNTVQFNGVNAVVTKAVDTMIVATAPTGVATGPVSVTINGERTVGPVFTVVPPPVITTFDPSSGPVGTSISITGNYFSSIINQNQVSFNGVMAVISSASATNLVVTVPKGATTGKITVTTNNQKGTGPVFNVQSLGVTTLSPDNGLDGTVVTITGIGFSTTASQDLVYFNGTLAKVTAATATQLTVTVPTGSSSGIVTVKVNGLTATGPVFTHAGVITLAGGPGTTVVDNFPAGIAVDPSGNVYISDLNHIIKITPAGVASTFAGDPNGATGFKDGNGTSALFNGTGLLISDSQGNLYVTDGGNQAIRKITLDGTVSTAKANLGFSPYSVGIDGKGVLYASNFSSIFRYDLNGLTATITTNANYQGFAVDAAGDVYFTSSIFSPDGLLYKYSASTGTTTSIAGTRYQQGNNDGPPGIGQLNGPGGMVLDPTTGYLMIADGGANAVREVKSDGTIVTITGGPIGYQDGSLSSAKFFGPTYIAVGKTGLIYITDRNNFAIREIATH